MRSLDLKPRAESDLREAAAWYEAETAGLGQRFMDAAVDMLTQIEEQPVSFSRLHGNIRRAGIRDFPYRMYFVVDPDRVAVFAVLHAARHPRVWRERLRDADQ